MKDAPAPHDHPGTARQREAEAASHGEDGHQRGARNAAVARRRDGYASPKLAPKSTHPAWWDDAVAATGFHRGGAGLTSGPHPTPVAAGWVETLAWQPRAFAYHGLLSPAECAHLKALAEPKLARSTAINPEVGKPARYRCLAYIGAPVCSILVIRLRALARVLLKLAALTPASVLRAR